MAAVLLGHRLQSDAGQPNIILMLKLRAAGFTVTELLIAMALFAIVVPLFAVGINNLTVLNNRARDLSLANMVAQNQFEALRSAGFNSIEVGNYDFTANLPSTLAEPKIATYEVTAPETGIKEVLVTITYSDYGSDRTVQYKSLISELGVAQ